MDAMIHEFEILKSMYNTINKFNMSIGHQIVSECTV